jgi:predicted DNA-binding protein with PD1-like motif
MKIPGKQFPSIYFVERKMKSQLLSKNIDPHEREETYVLIFESGDEVISELRKFVEEYKVSAARFSAIGAFSDATLAYFDWERKEYLDLPIEDQVEVLTLTGDVAVKNGEPSIHAHVIVGCRDGSAKGGHLKDAHVRPTLEMMLEKSPAHLHKSFHKESGLMLIDLDISDSNLDG